MACLSVNTSLLMDMVALVHSVGWYRNRVASDLKLMRVVDASWWQTTGFQIFITPSIWIVTSLHSSVLLAFHRRKWSTLKQSPASWPTKDKRQKDKRRKERKVGCTLSMLFWPYFTYKSPADFWASSVKAETFSFSWLSTLLKSGASLNCWATESRLGTLAHPWSASSLSWMNFRKSSALRGPWKLQKAIWRSCKRLRNNQKPFALIMYTRARARASSKSPTWYEKPLKICDSGFPSMDYTCCHILQGRTERDLRYSDGYYSW